MEAHLKLKKVLGRPKRIPGLPRYTEQGCRLHQILGNEDRNTVKMVVASTEEMSVTVSGIFNDADKARDISATAVRQASSVSSSMETLGKAVN